MRKTKGKHENKGEKSEVKKTQTRHTIMPGRSGTMRVSGGSIGTVPHGDTQAHCLRGPGGPAQPKDRNRSHTRTHHKVMRCPVQLEDARAKGEVRSPQRPSAWRVSTPGHAVQARRGHADAGWRSGRHNASSKRAAQTGSCAGLERAGSLGLRLPRRAKRPVLDLSGLPGLSVCQG